MRSEIQDTNSHIYDHYLKDTSSKSDDIKKKIGEMIKRIAEEHKADFGRFYPSHEDLSHLPEGSVLICIEFTLKKPYTSRGENEFYENPIIRDTFTRLPIVRPTTWKGNLRFAATQMDNSTFKDKDIIIGRLFGSGSLGEDGRRGRLHFFPTFFEEDGKDVITPISRKTRKPTRGPICLDVIKPGSKGKFYVLYTPYPRGKGFTMDEVMEDLGFLAEALKLMFYTYGFSARRTSGFGVINKKVNGKLWVPKESHEFKKLHELRDKIMGLDFRG